jgi:hypothetical protein
VIYGYLLTTLLLLAMTGTSMVVDGELGRLDRMRLVTQFQPWVIGLLWLATATATSVVALRRSAPWLALAVAGSFAVTSGVLYVWADSVAVVGHGAWDMLRGLTGGGVYPIVVVLIVVVAGTLVTLARSMLLANSSDTSQRI